MENRRETSPSHFIRSIIEDDLAKGRHSMLVTRFPPEPNGYLHIGHAKSICLNFGLAWEFTGRCHLRFDDTNPLKEDEVYVDSIQKDVAWLGYEWGDHLYFASDYFEQLYQFAVELIKKEMAFVCSLSPEEIRQYRGTLTEPGVESPYRSRSVQENLDLFARMRQGEFSEGEHVLRAKIDMASSNLNMRDPVIFRIIHARHHRRGYQWCIYPTYDFAHCLSDALEGVTHSLCSQEFEDNRPLYDWFVDHLSVPCRPKQIEFARMNLTYTVLSKRKLNRLVQEGHVSGWDDPRMPTISGLRRRGYTPRSVRNFCDMIGVGRSESMVQMSMLEHSLRDDLNFRAPRYLGVQDPLKVVLVNYPEETEEEMEAINNPEDESMGTRRLPFCRELYIERDDFREDPPRKYFRLAPGREVRLRYAYFITCVDVIKNDEGEIVELHCTYDPESRGGSSPDGRKVKGTLHWVSARHSLNAQFRLYDRLFTRADPTAEEKNGVDFLQYINPDSLRVIENCKVEPGLQDMQPGTCFQFERKGYFCVDPDSTADSPVFNMSVALKDTWAKIERRESGSG